MGYLTMEAFLGNKELMGIINLKIADFLKTNNNCDWDAWVVECLQSEEKKLAYIVFCFGIYSDYGNVDLHKELLRIDNIYFEQDFEIATSEHFMEYLKNYLTKYF